MSLTNPELPTSLEPPPGPGRVHSRFAAAEYGRWPVAAPKPLGGLEHGAAEGVGAGAGEEEKAGVADLLEINREVLPLHRFFPEVHVDPELKTHRRLHIGHGILEFVDETTGQTGRILGYFDFLSRAGENPLDFASSNLMSLAIS